MVLKESVLLGLCMLVVQICQTTSLPAASSCLDKHQCPSGHFCSVSHYCALCTDCSAYNRVAGTECAQGILECGDCFSGFIMGSINPIGTCIEDSTRTAEVATDNSPPVYVWVTLAICLVALITAIVFFVKLIKYKGLINLNGTAEIRVLSPTPTTLTEIGPRSNGSVPTPIFNPAPIGRNMYVPLRPTSPDMNPPYEGYLNLPRHHEYIEESNMVHVTSHKETDLNQAAEMLKPPCYEDLLETDEGVSEVLLPQDEETSETVFPQEETASGELLSQDEATLESTWTQEQQVNNNEASGLNFSNVVNESRGTILIRPPTYENDPDGPPRKIPRVQADNGRDTSDGPSSAAQRIPSIDQPPSLLALPTASTQGSNGILLRGDTRIRHNSEEYTSSRPSNTEINNNIQNSSSNSSDGNNNNNDRSSSGDGPMPYGSMPSSQQPVQGNIYISFQQNNVTTC